ncbi:MAG: hypothetical protein IPJ65_29865 [Archangiaceae bacterium]|nr:hypothetical protein [Archangiaceae bacterium]
MSVGKTRSFSLGDDTRLEVPAGDAVVVRRGATAVEIPTTSLLGALNGDRAQVLDLFDQHGVGVGPAADGGINLAVRYPQGDLGRYTVTDKTELVSALGDQSRAAEAARFDPPSVDDLWSKLEGSNSTPEVRAAAAQLAHQLAGTFREALSGALPLFEPTLLPMNSHEPFARAVRESLSGQSLERPLSMRWAVRDGNGEEVAMGLTLERTRYPESRSGGSIPAGWRLSYDVARSAYGETARTPTQVIAAGSDDFGVLQEKVKRAVDSGELREQLEAGARALHSSEKSHAIVPLATREPYPGTDEKFPEMKEKVRRVGDAVLELFVKTTGIAPSNIIEVKAAMESPRNPLILNRRFCVDRGPERLLLEVKAEHSEGTDGHVFLKASVSQVRHAAIGSSSLFPNTWKRYEYATLQTALDAFDADLASGEIESCLRDGLKRSFEQMNTNDSVA